MQCLALMIIWWPAWLRSQAFQIVGVAGFIKLLNMMTLTGYLYVNVLNEKSNLHKQIHTCEYKVSICSL